MAKHAHYARFAANAYATVDVATGVASASPHQLTLMLYDAALMHMGKAHAHMAAGRVAEKGASITMAIRIVEEGLNAALDLSQGELARNLRALYEYISRRLLKSSLRNDLALLAETRTLLLGMRDTWAAIAPSVRVLDGSSLPNSVETSRAMRSGFSNSGAALA